MTSVPRDYKETAKWYKLAAEQGNARAQYNRGVMAANGWGVLADYVIAQMQNNIAAANRNEKGAENREDLIKKMTPEDISNAEAMAGVRMNCNYEKCGY